MNHWVVQFMNSMASWVVVAWLISPLLLTGWAVTDAKRRNRSPLLVALFVVLFFPIGLIAWLLFRPEPNTPSSRRSPFNLQDYRIQ